MFPILTSAHTIVASKCCMSQEFYPRYVTANGKKLFSKLSKVAITQDLDKFIKDRFYSRAISLDLCIFITWLGCL